MLWGCLDVGEHGCLREGTLLPLGVVWLLLRGCLGRGESVFWREGRVLSFCGVDERGDPFIFVLFGWVNERGRGNLRLVEAAGFRFLGFVWVFREGETELFSDMTRSWVVLLWV